MHRGRSGLKTPVHPDIPDWDDLRLFLALAKAGSFLAAARGLGIDHATVARRIISIPPNDVRTSGPDSFFSIVSISQ